MRFNERYYAIYKQNKKKTKAENGPLVAHLIKLEAIIG